ncbi:MAG: hypothetical protein GX267_04000 [Fibrobacter sp.]|jgi:hypothetical protein|nr:hypothetical protein [Fibrobacter sp.]
MRLSQIVWKMIAPFSLVIMWNTIAASSLPLNRIDLPDGFVINEYVSGIPDARSMAMGPKGTLIVGTRNDGRLWAASDTNGDFRADRKVLSHQD